MKETLSISDIANKLLNDHNAAWSPAGSRALAEYLDEQMPEGAEFDCVEIRCEYSEHRSLVAWAEDYFGHKTDWAMDLGIGDDADILDVEDKLRDYINDRGALIEFASGLIVSSF